MEMTVSIETALVFFAAVAAYTRTEYMVRQNKHRHEKNEGPLGTFSILEAKIETIEHRFIEELKGLERELNALKSDNAIHDRAINQIEPKIDRIFESIDELGKTFNSSIRLAISDLKAEVKDEINKEIKRGPQ